MNKVFLSGVLIKDPEFKYVGNSNIALATFALAVDRKKSKDGLVKSDIFNICAWEEKAELCKAKLKKGNLVVIEGSIAKNKYTMPNGENKMYTNIILSNIRFAESEIAISNEIVESENNVVNAKDLFEEEQIVLDIDVEKIPF
jgi:single-strand DNA-binding protein